MSLSFRIVQLFKDRNLGSATGSYGTVCRAKCDGLHCAAKIISEGSYSPVTHQKSAFKKDCPVPAFKKLEQAVEFLGTIRHPHLVQYLGVHRDYATGHPVILIELLDSNLTDFLESSSQPITYHQEASICHDIAQALSFLHSYGIVHRYLSSNNVLLNADDRAKVGDFGNSKLMDLGIMFSSRNPRANVYMPPESLAVPAGFSEKSDCFSFGVLVVQILSRHFPLPTDKSLADTEVGRRQHHIGTIDPNHPLLATALHCLRDSPSERPTAQQLCDRIASVKDIDYTSTAESDNDSAVFEPERNDVAGNAAKDPNLLSMEVQLQQKEKIIATLTQEIEELEQQLEEVKKSHIKEIAQKNWMITESQIRLGSVNEKLERSEEARASLERQSLALETWAQQPVTMTTVESKRKIKLEWEEESCSPFSRDFSRFCSNAVVDGDMLFFKSALSPEIYTFDCSEGDWSEVPNCPHVNGYCSIAVVNNLLTTVGDYEYGGKYSNRLYSLTTLNHWTKAFPSMPTKRCLATVLSTGTALIVAGGRGVGRVVSQTVEVMDTKRCKWFIADDLPEPLFCSSATVCGDRIYLVGGKDHSGLSTPAVYTCSLNALIKSCKSGLLRAHHPLLPEPVLPQVDRPSIWSRLADLPVVSSTCVTLSGQVLAIGGRELNHSATTSIHVYNSSANSWVSLDHRMSTPRTECFAVVLPDNRLMVAGGYTASGNTANTVEIATVS